MSHSFDHDETAALVDEAIEIINGGYGAEVEGVIRYVDQIVNSDRDIAYNENIEDDIDEIIMDNISNANYVSSDSELTLKTKIARPDALRDLEPQLSIFRGHYDAKFPFDVYITETADQLTAKAIARGTLARSNYTLINAISDAIHSFQSLLADDVLTVVGGNVLVEPHTRNMLSKLQGISFTPNVAEAQPRQALLTANSVKQAVEQQLDILNDGYGVSYIKLLQAMDNNYTYPETLVIEVLFNGILDGEYVFGKLPETFSDELYLAEARSGSSYVMGDSPVSMFRPSKGKFMLTSNLNLYRKAADILSILDSNKWGSVTEYGQNQLSDLFTNYAFRVGYDEVQISSGLKLITTLLRDNVIYFYLTEPHTELRFHIANRLLFRQAELQ